MFMTKELSTIPNTLEMLGDPLKTRGSNSSNKGMKDHLTYAMRVKLNTSADTFAGKIIDINEAQFSGQPKFSRNIDGLYALSYVGLDTIYADNFKDDPTWTDPDSVMDYDTDKKYQNITFDGLAFQKVYKNPGNGSVYNNTNSFIIRYTFELPDFQQSFYKSTPTIGFFDSGDNNYNNTIGIQCGYLLSDTSWSFFFRSQTNFYPSISSELNSVVGGFVGGRVYVCDLIYNHHKSELIAKFWDQQTGYMGRMVRRNIFPGSISVNSIGIIGSGTEGGPNNFNMKLYGAQVWMNAVVVKTSRDGCRSFEKVGGIPSVVGSDIQECAVAVSSSPTIFAVWTQKSGTPSGFYNVWYSKFIMNPADGTPGSWSSPIQASNTSGNYDRLSPNVVALSNNTAFVTWKIDTVAPDIIANVFA